MDRRHFTKLLATGTAAAALGTVTTGTASATSRTSGNVVLVHGAYADGSCWSKVIPILQAAGVTVTSVQNPLTSLDDDVACTRRALDLQTGPTVLVGHSYGGAVITQAGDHPLVSSLVYLSARAPAEGEDYTALAGQFPTPPANAGLVFHNGFGGLTEQAFLNDFANGVPRDQARALYAVQGRIAQTLFAGRVTAAAWRTKPSRYLVTTADRTTSPELQRFVAKRMNAVTSELPTGHLSFVVRPEAVARLILSAVRA
ncbi:alpha/beta fold hydrolase [Kutzneria kofuensis]|uniref:Pimeloyl-ACP methyl ester carboxylesterase n=1 Tax=Kutzneria kofuensis TaxID=103725 RepID=A0A7W9NFD6_9PSEU|nr:alpha/beta hydrolase [Kutzneria kofuensis]MBB5890016.1 pimeloyl-ACP methyl ester carboxylesterase [Kutzneria kofuensis]